MAANWRGRAAISDCSEMEEIYPRELKTFVMRSVVIFAFGGSLARGVRKGGTATALRTEAANRHGAKCEKYGDVERTLTGRGIKGHTGTSKGGVSEGLAMTNDEVCWRGGGIQIQGLRGGRRKYYCYQIPTANDSTEQKVESRELISNRFKYFRCSSNQNKIIEKKYWFK